MFREFKMKLESDIILLNNENVLKSQEFYLNVKNTVDLMKSE